MVRVKFKPPRPMETGIAWLLARLETCGKECVANCKLTILTILLMLYHVDLLANHFLMRTSGEEQ